MCPWSQRRGHNLKVLLLLRCVDVFTIDTIVDMADCRPINTTRLDNGGDKATKAVSSIWSLVLPFQFSREQSSSSQYVNVLCV
jgi:hypothetical protein